MAVRMTVKGKVSEGPSAASVPPAEEASAAAQAARASALAELAKIARREMRRADRTRTSLSIAVLRIAADGDADDSRIARLWEVVRHNSRETDLPFRIDPNLVVVMLLDTDAAGASAFVQKILAQARDASPGATVHEYPGPLFQSLLSGEPDFSIPARPTSGPGQRHWTLPLGTKFRRS